MINIDDYILRLGIFKKIINEFIGWCCIGMKEEFFLLNREIMYVILNEY